MHSSNTLRLNGADYDGPASLKAGMFTTPEQTSPRHARHRMQAVAMTLACLGMLGTVHAQDAAREDLAGSYDATVARTSTDPALGTVSATFNVTGSSNVRGIWGKSGTLSIDAIGREAVFNVASTKNNAFGIDASSGVNLDIGTLAGTFNISAANTNATGIRSYGKILAIGTITANFSSNGIYAYQGRLDLGTLAGNISVELGTGNFARGLYAYGSTMDYQGPRYKDVNIGDISSTGIISAVTAGGYGARGIQSNYGQVNISRLDGQITATSAPGMKPRNSPPSALKPGKTSHWETWAQREPSPPPATAWTPMAFTPGKNPATRPIPISPWARWTAPSGRAPSPEPLPE